MYMKKLATIVAFLGAMLPATAQQTLSLQDCREMALSNNKQLNISKLNEKVAYNTQKAMRTKYLPKVDAIGGYQFFSREISLLNSRQKDALTHLGSNSIGSLSTGASDLITSLVQQGLLTPQMAQQLAGLLQQYSPTLGSLGDQIGTKIKNAFRTDTHNIWSGSVMVREPVYMGGAINAANKIADINEQLAANGVDFTTQTTLYHTDQAYWMVVSLKQKEDLVYSYHKLIKKLSDDVHKMIAQGVATKSDGLQVDVKVNEADMQVTQVEDGLSLAKMYLCQLCGLPLDEDIHLADENKKNLDSSSLPIVQPTDSDLMTRPEIRILQNTIDISKQNTKMIRAEYLPHVLATGGYLVSSPNTFNGFQKQIAGVWTLGLTVEVPLWSWNEGSYKVRASEAASNIAEMQIADTREKIQLQISQSRFKIKEAHKRLVMTNQNLKSADENLRSADLGFKEGIMKVTDVMRAQTAWQQAQSEKIDAEVDLKLAQTELEKALGILR
jgi:outer membrane protein TolC